MCCETEFCCCCCHVNLVGYNESNMIKFYNRLFGRQLLNESRYGCGYLFFDGSALFIIDQTIVAMKESFPFMYTNLKV